MAEPKPTEASQVKTMSEAQKDREERKKKSDSSLAQLKKEFESKPEDRIFKGEDEFKVLAEKLSKARDKFNKANAAASDSEDPNVTEFRELRTKSYGEYQVLLDEIIRRARIELESR